MIHILQVYVNHIMAFRMVFCLITKKYYIMYGWVVLEDVQLSFFSLNGKVLRESNSVKYVGHFLCNDLSDNILRQRTRHLSIQGTYNDAF